MVISLYVLMKRTSVGHALGWPQDKSFEPSEGSAYPAGERSLTFNAEVDRGDQGKVLAVKSWMFLDEDFEVARAVDQMYNLNTYSLSASTDLLYTKISEQEFRDGIESTLNDINTVENLQFPMTRACLGSGEIYKFLNIITLVPSPFFSKMIFLYHSLSN